MTASQLISPHYAKLNQELHSQREDYGAMSAKWVPLVAKLAEVNNFASILDYGAGKRGLERGLREHWVDAPVCEVVSYDPCVPGLEHKQPCDLVVCTDVLEHIEPDCLDAVLDDISAMTLKMAFLVINTGPAQKTLADGRNAHLIQEGLRFWTPRIWDRFEILRFEQKGRDIHYVVAREPMAAQRADKQKVVVGDQTARFA